MPRRQIASISASVTSWAVIAALIDQPTTRSTAFYVDQLGFKIRPAKPLQGGRPFTAFHQGIALVAGRKAGERQIDHIAFEVNDVRNLRDRLKANQATFFQDLHDGPYGLTIYIADPDKAQKWSCIRSAKRRDKVRHPYDGR